MNEHKEGRWKELFESFEKSFALLSDQVAKDPEDIYEVASLVHLHEMCLEHARKTMYGYLDAKGISVNTPRQAVKESFKHAVISNESQWHRAFNRRNLGYFLFTEKVEKGLVEDIKHAYYPMFEEFNRTMDEQR